MSGRREIDREVLTEAARLLAGSIREETGIPPRDLAVDARGETIRVRVGGRTVAERSGAAGNPAALAETLHASLPDDLRERLVDLERARLSGLVADPVLEAVRAALARSRPGEEWDVSVDVVELPYAYRHGDPEDAQEEGYPPFAVEARSWDPDAAVTVEIEYEPPDADRLARAAADGLVEELEGDG